MRPAPLAFALALCACGSEPSFDDRFSRSSKEIDERAQGLDAQLNRTDAIETSNNVSDVQPD